MTGGMTDEFTLAVLAEEHTDGCIVCGYRLTDTLPLASKVL